MRIKPITPPLRLQGGAAMKPVSPPLLTRLAPVRLALIRLALVLAAAPPALIAGAPGAQAQSAAPGAPVVELARAAPAATGQQRVFVGRAKPLRVVDLAFQVSGQILELPVFEGQRLARGALIARLDTVDFELAAERAQVTRDLARLERTRSFELADRGAATQARLDTAQTELAQAEIVLREAQRRLTQATITAPFDALVSRVIADRYANTTPAQPVVRLQDVSEMRIAVSLPEEIAALARTGAGNFSFTATFPAAPGHEAALILREFVTEADPVAQTYEVEFAIEGDADPRLLPGMTAKVTGVPVMGARQAPVSIPVEAIDTTGAAQPQVWVFDPASQTASPRAVALGLPRDGAIVVLDGLSPGEEVVTGGWWRLTDGAQVRPSRP